MNTTQNFQHIRKLASILVIVCIALLNASQISARSLSKAGTDDQAAVTGIDLDVTYISRTPRYDWNKTKQWPDPGETVTFTAHVLNKGSASSGSFPYEWRLDGQVVHSSTASSLAPGAEATFTWNWSWQTGQHLVSFRADPANANLETTEVNNEISDYTDAMTLGFWVEQSVYNEFNNTVNGRGTYSWEDWAQSIVQEMNLLFVQSVYPLAPQGALTRVRLDKVTIVPDGTLFNLNYQHAPQEYATDAQWGFSVDEYLHCSMTNCYTAPWWVDHELMHYLYSRIDIYAFDVQGGDVQVRDETGNLIAGTPALPYLIWDVLRYASRSYDLMHWVDPQTIFSDYTIYSLNADWPAGQRTHRSDWEHYFLEIPANTQIRVLDNNDLPMPNIQVSVYQAVWGDGSSGPYSQNYDNIADISGTTNSQGIFSLGSQPFGNLKQYGTPAGVALIKLRNTATAQSRYVWLELTDLNMAYWRGQTNVYVHDVYFPSGQKSLRLERNQLSFRVVQGTNPIPQNIKVGLLGEGVSEWTVSLPGQTWLRTIPSPQLSAQWYEFGGPLTFIVDSSHLPLGTYTTDVTVTAVTGVLNSPQTVNVTLEVVKPPTFADVPIDHWAWSYIERVYAAGITGGCTLSPLKYCPGNTVTRAQMAIFLLRAEHGSTYTPPAATGMFSDVPKTDSFAPWIEQLANEQITGGCSATQYCPTNPVTRAQMAIFLLRAEHGFDYVPPAATGMFLDVPKTDFTAPFIEQLANEQITGGCGGGKYCPAKAVTRDQMAIFLVRAFKLP